jgi:hypothetical protein
VDKSNPQKKKKSEEIYCFGVLDVFLGGWRLHEGLMINILQFFDKKN